MNYPSFSQLNCTSPSLQASCCRGFGRDGDARWSSWGAPAAAVADYRHGRSWQARHCSSRPRGQFLHISNSHHLLELCSQIHSKDPSWNLNLVKQLPIYGTRSVIGRMMMYVLLSSQWLKFGRRVQSIGEIPFQNGPCGFAKVESCVHLWCWRLHVVMFASVHSLWDGVDSPTRANVVVSYEREFERANLKRSLVFLFAAFEFGIRFVRVCVCRHAWTMAFSMWWTTV